MGLVFLNTFTRKKEPFVSIEPGKVELYTCGPTIYDFAHSGNFRTFLFEDLLRRYLKYKGFSVVHVMNLTDVDDRTITASRKEGIRLSEYTARYGKAFFEDLKTLNVEPAEHYPAATAHINEMVEIIQKLLKESFAYESGGSIYYKISAFPGYGTLPHFKPDELKAGAGVAADSYEKEEVRDLAPRKTRAPGGELLVALRASFGRGKKDVQVPRQFLHVAGFARQRIRPGSHPLRSDFRPLPDASELHFRGHDRRP